MGFNNLGKETLAYKAVGNMGAKKPLFKNKKSKKSMHFEVVRHLQHYFSAFDICKFDVHCRGTSVHFISHGKRKICKSLPKIHCCRMHICLSCT